MNRNEVEKLTEGLLYMSETDAPFKYFELDEEAARQWPPTTATQLPELIGKEPKTPVLCAKINLAMVNCARSFLCPLTSQQETLE